MTERRPDAVVCVVLADERCPEHRCGPGVIRFFGHRLVGHKGGLKDDAGRLAYRLNFITDSGNPSLHEGDKPRGAEADCPACRRNPLDVTSKDAGTQVQHALVSFQLTVSDVERLVVHEQAEKLAVGNVDHRLACLGVAVATLGIGQWQGLEKPIQVRTGDPMRLPLIEIPA
jgi:hypothetical protein